MPTPHQLSDDIWDVADLLRGDYKQSDYGKVILPFTVLRRLDAVLEPNKDAVLEKLPDVQEKGAKVKDQLLKNAAGQPFYNTSRFTFSTLTDEPDHIADNLIHYVHSFSPGVREIFEYFAFPVQVNRLDKGGTEDLLFRVVERFKEVDLRPPSVGGTVDNHVMGSVFEELIRKFAEQSNETAGEHFTPREVIKLMVNLLFLEDRDILAESGIVRTLYDPACGTGGMLSVAEDYLHDLNPPTEDDPGGRLVLFGQEVNPESYAICKADMLIKGHDTRNIKFGNSFTTDELAGERFDYMISNPPFGVSWRKVQKFVTDEHQKRGHEGRFGAGLPRVSDGSFLFLQHLLAKRKETGRGSRVVLVFNGSPMFAGGAGSGESEIRRWIIGNDWLEAIVALPDQLFYNTGIGTYLWIVTNRKSDDRKGKVQLIDARACWLKMDRSLGSKRHKLGGEAEGETDHIGNITRVYGMFDDYEPEDASVEPRSKVFDNDDFGYRRVVIDRPLRARFQRTAEVLESLKTLSGVPNQMGERAHAILSTGFEGDDAEQTYGTRSEFAEAMDALWQASGLPRPSSAQWDKMVMAFAVPDPEAEVVKTAAGRRIADKDRRDYEEIPLTEESVKAYVEREVKPHAPDAWLNPSYRDDQDGEVGRVGYEIPLGRHFYQFEPPPGPDEITALEAEIRELEEDIQRTLPEVLA